jgi:hypothetical protein
MALQSRTLCCSGSIHFLMMNKRSTSPSNDDADSKLFRYDSIVLVCSLYVKLLIKMHS